MTTLEQIKVEDELRKHFWNKWCYELYDEARKSIIERYVKKNLIQRLLLIYTDKFDMEIKRLQIKLFNKRYNSLKEKDNDNRR